MFQRKGAEGFDDAGRWRQARDDLAARVPFEIVDLKDGRNAWDDVGSVDDDTPTPIDVAAQDVPDISPWQRQEKHLSLFDKLFERYGFERLAHFR